MATGAHAGATSAVVDVDPWGGETTRSWNSQQQPRKYTTYERDSNADDEAMMRRYSRRHGRFSQPDPYHGSYDLTDPQSFNRYSYVSNDPVNFTDPSGLDPVVMLDGMGGGWSYGPLGVYGGYASGGVAGSRTFAVFRTETGGEESRFAGFAILGGGSGGSGVSVGFFVGGGSRKNGPHDPNSDFCKSLLQKIENIRKDISKRMDEFMRNPQNLPLQIPGAKLRDDQLGHLKIIMDAHDNLQRRIEEYTDRCGGPPPGIPIPGNPVGNKKLGPGINRQAAGKALVTTGGLVTAYFIIRTILRVVYPPSNLVPVP